MIDWNSLTAEDLGLIDLIVSRMVTEYPTINAAVARMDIAAAHVNSPLDLKALLEADRFNFVHDTAGIITHIDRTTGILRNSFFPRYSIRKVPCGEFFKNLVVFRHGRQRIARAHCSGKRLCPTCKDYLKFKELYESKSKGIDAI